MKLTKEDEQLIKEAKELLQSGEKKLSGGETKEVACALLTKKGKLFTGVNIDLVSGIGFCAEHSAVADMISHSNETQIKTLVAVYGKKIIAPCGRCCEMLRQVNKKNWEETEIIISSKQKVKLKQLLPYNWW